MIGPLYGGVWFNVWVPLTVALAGTVWLFACLHRDHFFLWQYLYFLRFPILTRVVLLVLPVAMLWLLPHMLGNLAIVTPWGVFLVSVLATWTALIGLFTSNVLVGLAESRSQLSFRRRPGAKAGQPTGWLARFILCMHEVARGRWKGRENVLPRRLRLLLHGGFALPLIAVVVYRSVSESDSDGVVRWYVLAAFAGFCMAVAAPIAVRALVPRVADAIHDPMKFAVRQARRVVDDIFPHALLERLAGITSVAAHLVGPFDRLDLESLLRKDFEAQGQAPRQAARYAKRFKPDLLFFALFFGLTMGLYVLGASLLKPESGFGVPPLALVLVLVALWSLLLAAASGMLDVYRAPVLLILPLALFLVYQVGDIDHHYESTRVSGLRERGTEISPMDAYRAWRRHRNPDGEALVVVAASGGGITASFWTAEVLRRLQREVPSFGASLLAVSSVSGGGIGAMYHIGAYRDGRAPAGALLDSAVAASRASSLSATVWGLAYLDFWRFVPSWDRTRDRGRALEQTWLTRLEGLDGWDSVSTVGMPGERGTLRRWRHDVALGVRPIQIFNATITETGQRFLFAPLDLSPDAPHESEAWGAVNFLDLYGNWDVAVPTAARLSATFPFVSPIARIAAEDVPARFAYHLADGGYYDNHGVITAIDFLRAILPELSAPSNDTVLATPYPVDATTAYVGRPFDVRRIVLIQIRTRSPELADARGRQGFRFAALGPAVTMNNVRGSSQVSRNDLEVALLQKAWGDRIPIETEVFELCVDGPLSWHLSASEAAAVIGGWTGQHAQKLARIRGWLGDGPPVDSALDCSEMPPSRWHRKP